MTEAWFARALSLERKHAERSRKPFVLVLMNIEGVEALNGNKDGGVHQVVNAVASFTRNGSVLGTIFTELGTSQTPSSFVACIASKIGSVLKTYVEQEKSAKIDVSCHVFPKEWAETKPGGRIDSKFYPDLQTHGKPRWLHNAGQSGRFAALMDRLIEPFDWIIIDSTPILPVADTSVWARLGHGIIVAVREAKSEKRQLKKALDAPDNTNLIGGVLNSSSNNEHKSYYTYYGTSHHNGKPE